MNIALTILIAIFSAAAGLLPSTGKMYDNSTRFSGMQRIQPRMWLVLCLSVVSLSLIWLQNYLNDQASKEKEKQTRVEQDRRDSIQKNAFEASNLRAILTITRTQAEILGKYGYRLDSANNRLVKIVKDSSKTRVILPDRPVLTVCDMGEGAVSEHENKPGYLTYKVTICSENAYSSKYNLKSNVFLSDTLKNITYVDNVRTLTQDDEIAKDGARIILFTISKPTIQSHVIIHISGTYKDSGGVKTYYVNEVCYYNRMNKLSGLLAGKSKEDIIRLSESKM